MFTYFSIYLSIAHYYTKKLVIWQYLKAYFIYQMMDEFNCLIHDSQNTILHAH